MRGRKQYSRMGIYRGGVLQSAPMQLYEMTRASEADLLNDSAIDLGCDRFARQQQVVSAGMFINEVPQIDIANGTFTADFYFWIRFMPDKVPGAADPEHIEFPGMLKTKFYPASVVAKGNLDDCSVYRLWHVLSDFKGDFDLHRYPLDRQTLALRFFNARAASEQIIYIPDRRQDELKAHAMEQVKHASTPDTLRLVDDRKDPTLRDFAPDIFRRLTQWTMVKTNKERTNLVTPSSLGDPRLVGQNNVRGLSGFKMSIEVRRRLVSTMSKSMLPLGLLTLILFASLFFPDKFSANKVGVAITAALSCAVLLTSLNSQLGNVGHVIAVEYLFYAFLLMCLLVMISVVISEQLRSASKDVQAKRVDHAMSIVFAGSLAVTAVAGWLASQYW